MEIAVIGGGAAGCFAALTAAGQGAHVSLYEGGSMPGKKLLATGNGRCNLTNLRMGPEFFRSEDRDRAEKVIESLTPEEVMESFGSMGVPCYDRDGYVYPRSNQAQTVRNALLDTMIRRGVKIHNNSRVLDLQVNGDGGFTILTESGYAAHADTVILTSGGRSMASTGSDGSGHSIAERLGHRMIPSVPALTSLILSDWPAALHGVRVNGTVKLQVDGGEEISEYGELQMTRSGISGIPVFQVSRYAARALAEGREVEAILELLPEGVGEMLTSMESSLSVSQAMRGLFPEKLAEVLLLRLAEKLLIQASCRLESLTSDDMKKIRALLSELHYPVTGTGSFEESQVTCGGIALTEIDPNSMESLRIPGLFFAGEILDVDGICGGYNLHWAWTSGRCAGGAAAVRSLGISSYDKEPYHGTISPVMNGNADVPGEKKTGKKKNRRQEHRR